MENQKEQLHKIWNDIKVCKILKQICSYKNLVKEANGKQNIFFSLDSHSLTIDFLATIQIEHASFSPLSENVDFCFGNSRYTNEWWPTILGF